MKKKILLSPLIIMIFIIIAGIGIAGAAIFIGNTTGDNNSLGVNLQKGLVGWWDFNGNAKDKTPYRNHGTVTGAALTTDRKGQTNKAYDFDASGDYIRMGNVLNQPTNDFSISAWVKSTYNAGGGGNRNGIVYKKGTSQAFVAGYRLNMPDGNFVLSIADGTTANTLTTSPTDVYNNDVWHHVVGVVTRGIELRIYVDGVSVGDTPSTLATDITSTDSFEIGGQNTTAQLLTGSIDDVRIYNRALSATEVTALYQEYNPGIQVSDLKKGLVGNWDLNGNAKDATPQRNHGTVTGATLTTDRKGQTNKAYSFNGTTDYMDMGDVSLLNFERTNSFTTSTWVNTSSLSAIRFIVSKMLSTGNITGWGLYHLTTGEFVMLVRNDLSPSNQISIQTTNAFATGSWHHVAMVYSGTSLASGVKIYVDGVDEAITVNSDTLSASIQNSAPVNIGTRNNGNLPYAGTIDDVRIYNRALSATEITALYQEYNPGIVVSDLSKGLVGNWSLDGNAKDRTPYRNHGTVTAATLTTDRKGEINKAYSFNGTTANINLGDKTTFEFPGASSTFSIGAWVRLTSVPTKSGAIFSKYTTAAGGNREYIFGVDTATLPFIAFYGGGDTTNTLTIKSDTALSTLTWYHVTVTINFATTSYLLYINGVPVDTTTTIVGSGVSSVFAGSALAYIGAVDRSSTAPDNFFPGSIDDVRIYNRALSSTEVQQLYQSY